MEKLIIIKYGELTTKKANINFFIKTLKDNLKKSLISYNPEINYDKGRMFIVVDENDYNPVIKRLQNTFGIHEIIVGNKYEERDLESIQNNLGNLLKDETFTTFKVFTKRSDKKYELDSMEISRKVGGYILRNFPGTSVDVHNPEMKINIEVRLDAVYIYFDSVNGIGGYPVGTQGKGLLMLSGGIDSPVAGYLAMKRGIRLDAIYFESPPHTSENAKNKVISLAKKLSEYNLGIKLHVINFTKIQEEIYKNIPHEYLITIMRRMMYRISERVVNKIGGNVLVNGESVGQVASQTLTSMRVINEVINIPVIRPVACFDKLEIIDVAKKIDTYETSILPYEDCCTIFVPDHPVINPVHDKCVEYEKLIDVDSLVLEAVKNEEVLKLTSNQNKYQDLL